ncbi:hypothetical protein HDV57DRAFT_485169 [Trichoderma longibrachiatum]
MRRREMCLLLRFLGLLYVSACTQPSENPTYNSKYYVTLLEAASSGANSLVLRRRTSSGHVRDNDSALTKNY